MNTENNLGPSSTEDRPIIATGPATRKSRTVPDKGARGNGPLRIDAGT